MGHVEIASGQYFLSDGRPLLRDVSLRLGEGHKTCLIGPNGTGKTTLLKLLYGSLLLHSGTRSHSGLIGMMSQFVGQVRDASTVRDLLLLSSGPAIHEAATSLRRREFALLQRNDESSQMAYAQALVDWGDAGGYEEEIRWDKVTQSALGRDFQDSSELSASVLSGGEQKRLVFEALISGPHDVLLLDEPDNYLDVPGKRRLEAMIADSPKSILFVSHDREIIAKASTSIATLERGPAGASTWTFQGGFDRYHEARSNRNDRIDELRRRWNDDEEKLKSLVQMYKLKAAYNSDMASRYQAAKTRLAKFRADGPPDVAPVPERVRMDLAGGRTAKRAVLCNNLELVGLMRPFSVEIWYGDRVAILGSNGSGKSHLLRLLAQRDLDSDEGQIDGAPLVDHRGNFKLGERVRPGYFAQTHHRPDFAGKSLLAILARGHRTREGMARNEASSALGRYGLVKAAEQSFDSLSGGQQARFQILLLELEGSTLLLLDEPTDNLDIESAEALEAGLEAFAGTVLTVTHDRWFARSFSRFLVFGSDGTVYESDQAVWDEDRVERTR